MKYPTHFISSTKAKVFATCLLIISLNGCSVLTGTKVWCEYMEEKSKADWSINEAKEYAKNCVFED
ncbi:DUF3012 domain-containing protein [Glaciecola sp. SC05]|uniref:DUF3012 domain-containing protein n=1 Tax=Glaciecola sp. SC05 TaxID=1987355 RepID=UPI003527D000